MSQGIVDIHSGSGLPHHTRTSRSAHLVEHDDDALGLLAHLSRVVLQRRDAELHHVLQRQPAAEEIRRCVMTSQEMQTSLGSAAAQNSTSFVRDAGFTHHPCIKELRGGRSGNKLVPQVLKALQKLRGVIHLMHHEHGCCSVGRLIWSHTDPRAF